MTEASRAVFLSYASPDAEAARHLCDALRAAGVEVWLDQSALRGGDAWDAMIRRQVKECALFLPIISASVSRAALEATAEVAAASTGRADNAEAHRLYLQGRFYRQRITQEDLA